MNLAHEKALAETILHISRWPHAYSLVGSAAWKEDPADVDYAVFFINQNQIEAFMDDLLADGWKVCSAEDVDEYDGTDWTAVRKGNLNFMLTTDRAWYDLFLKATEVCKYLRLEPKEARVAVNQIIRDGRKAANFPLYRIAQLDFMDKSREHFDEGKQE